MTAARNCLGLVEKAVAAAQQAQDEMIGSRGNDFDRIAIHCAIEYLERALEELKGFASTSNAFRPAIKK
jgi:hypothetical protein